MSVERIPPTRIDADAVNPVTDSNGIPPSRRWPAAFRLPVANPEEYAELMVGLMRESRLSLNYLILVIGSCVIATLGLMANSPAVIIGAMIVAPLMLPIRGMAMGALEGNLVLFRTGILSIIVGTGIGVGVSFLLGRLVGLPEWGSEVLARTQPNLLDLGVALAAGGIGAFARVRKEISDSLAGVAIAVALMPPVCVIGLGLAHADWSTSLGATLLYATNLLGIALACMVTFLAMGYAPLHKARSALSWMLGLVLLLVVPLGAGMTRLVYQARLEAALRSALLNKTITFQRVTLVRSDFNWVVYPPEVVLSVRADEPITPRQVTLLEEFVESDVGRPFTLIFQVVEAQEIRRETPAPEDPVDEENPGIPSNPAASLSSRVLRGIIPPY
ncbi:DUF389 domain-containing protein [Synechococcus sp. Nb3U1]|uniref:DUF389 domain-containing protein n=1 Tax=Synechococcus sp. Nb3U1 TaxID=1914529 RepID=UPI001F323A9C|nr:DUF389 domain-containing protein [Synechococcus sp. Nb3U1]MCF2972416.1 DUF389 domain-containing protein [Synechococcus sp. Nb3U1]